MNGDDFPNLLDGAGRAIRFQLDETQNGLGRMPLLSQSDLGSFDTLASQFPHSLEPISVAYQQYDAIFLHRGLRHVLGDIPIADRRLSIHPVNNDFVAV